MILKKYLFKAYFLKFGEPLTNLAFRNRNIPYRRSQSFFNFFKSKPSEDEKLAKSNFDLGLKLLNDGKFKEAIEIFSKSIETLEKHKQKNTGIMNCNYHIGTAYFMSQKYDQALDYLFKAEEYGKKVFGPESIYLFNVYNQIGICYEHQNQLDDALKFYLQALSNLEKNYKEDHPSMGTICTNIGNILHKMRKFNQAEEFYTKSFILYLKIFKEEHPLVGTAYNNLGSVYHNLGNFNKALEFYRNALRIKGKLVGQHPSLATIYMNIGNALFHQKEMSEAKQNLLKALELQNKSQPNSDLTGQILHNLALICEADKNYIEAINFYEQSYKIWKIHHKDDYKIQVEKLMSLAKMIKDEERINTYSLELDSIKQHSIS